MISLICDSVKGNDYEVKTFWLDLPHSCECEKACVLKLHRVLIT